jgi:hypothetical protein
MRIPVVPWSLGMTFMWGGTLSLVFALLACASWVRAHQDVPPKEGQAETSGPLAGLPSAPGPHIQKIEALADNTWLNLGSPVADPKWGKGRGRSWSAHMSSAPDLKAAFLFGEGVHCWWNKQNNRYMDDLFVYDVQGHRWICAYPGTDVVTVDLKLDKNGFEVGKDGRPVPVAQLVHGYEMVSYDTDLRRFMFMPGSSGDWQAGAPFGKTRLGWGVKGQGMPKSNSPWLYDVRSGRWDLRKVVGPAPASGLANVSVYVPSAKKLFYWRANQPNEAWFYDPEANGWSVVKAKGPPPPFGIDASACLDLKRERIYIGGGYYPVSKGPHAFWCYDLKTNTWVDLQPKGKPCKGCNRYGPNHAIMNYDAANDVVVLIFHRWQMAPTDGDLQPGPGSRGVYVYDPTANSWAERPLAMPKEIGQCPSGFYNPNLNAHFLHVAGDSEDNGVMWVYRYKSGQGGAP